MGRARARESDGRQTAMQWDDPCVVTALFINRDIDYDWLIALEHGRICDGHPSEQFDGVDENCAYMLDRPHGRRVTGFVIHGLRDFDADAYPRLFEGPRFDVPLFGLAG